MASQAEETAAAVTSAYIARQRLLTLTLTRDLVLLVRELFTPTRPGPSWAATKVQLRSLIRDRHRLAADLGARYYLDLRTASLQPSSARELRASAVAEPAVPERPPTRQVVESVATEPKPRSVEPELSADVEDALGLGDLSEEDAWAELERLTRAHLVELDEDRIEANLNSTGIASYRRALRAGQTEARAVDTMAVNLSGSATTLTLEGGREVIRDAATTDEHAIGWIRVTDADPCSWCAMLASRGAVFRSAGTAGRNKNDRFTGEGQLKWHDHCSCAAVAVFNEDDPHLLRAEDLYDQWLRETQGHSGTSAVKAWRRYWENRDQEG